jgi:hypothetical protein
MAVFAYGVPLARPPAGTPSMIAVRAVAAAAYVMIATATVVEIKGKADVTSVATR